MKDRWLYRLERRIPWLAIPNLMLYIVAGTGVVYLCSLFFENVNAYTWLSMVPSLVAEGQVWRLITFVFLPETSNVFALLLSLYFYYMIGTTLEDSWGSFNFTLYYLLGMVGAILASLFTGSATNYFLNLSLFFAFAILYPNEYFNLFFFIPIKAKWLALLDAALYVYLFIFGGWADRAALLASLLNLAVFFGGDLIRRIRNGARYSRQRRNFRREMHESDRRNNYR